MLKKSTHKWPKRGSDEAKKALTRGQKGNSHLAKKGSHMAKKGLTHGQKSALTWPKKRSHLAKKVLTCGQKDAHTWPKKRSHVAKKALTRGQRFKSQIFVGPDSGKTRGFAVVLDFTRCPLYLSTYTLHKDLHWGVRFSHFSICSQSLTLLASVKKTRLKFALG